MAAQDQDVNSNAVFLMLMNAISTEIDGDLNNYLTMSKYAPA